MASNLERYKKDLDALIDQGERLGLAMEIECFPDKLAATLKQADSKTKVILAQLPTFSSAYQTWYSQAKALIRQLLPDRLGDFTRLYEKPKSRKGLTNESYRIEDYLQGLNVTDWNDQMIVAPSAAIPHFRQQRAIVSAVKARFDSSLFDIRQLVQADLFDSELESAAALVKNGFLRAAGAIAGVLLEKHLSQVLDNHAIALSKKNPAIGDLNNALKEADLIDVAQWRFIQHLADIRNICDHRKAADPSREQVNDLVEGVNKIIKTLF
jgi:hypothetical protein